jgi:hypothetical protein
VWVCVLPVIFDSRVDITPYSYAFSLAVSEFVFMFLSIELLFHKFLARHCITLRDKEDNALIVEVLWLYPR